MMGRYTVLPFLLVGLCAAVPSSELPQLVTTDRDGIWVFTANEEGIFEDGVFYFIGTGVEPWHLITVDVNGDGYLDIVSANRLVDPSVAVLLNTGEDFTDPVTYWAGEKPYHAAAGDFDGDGDQDLAVANPVSGGALVFLANNGDGTFSPGGELYLGDRTYAVASGDLNGDGVVDLAVVNNGDDEVLIFLGEGDWVFEQTSRLFPEESPKDVVLGTFNGDDLPDLAVPNYDSASVTVFVNDGGGFFDPGRSYDLGFAGESLEPRHLVTGDLDGDGLDDLVVGGGRGSQDIFVLFGEGDDRFTQAERYFTGPRPNAVAIFDVDGDTRQDILAANWSLDNEAQASVTVLAGGQTPRSFTWKQDLRPPTGIFEKVTFLVVGQLYAVPFVRGDVNNDGNVAISDPVLGLRYLFGFRTVPCPDSVDQNDDGKIDIGDPLRVLGYLFAGGPPPRPPFPMPGPDPTPDDLPCQRPAR